MEISSLLNTNYEQMTEVDKITSTLTNNRIKKFFDGVSHDIKFTCPEAAFLRIISWLFTIIRENLSSINITFISDKFEQYGISSETYRDFYEVIIFSRTVLQHSLNPGSTTDSQKIERYNLWLEEVIGKNDKLTSNDWQLCCQYILNNYKLILESVITVLNSIRNDEDFRDIIIDDWVGKTETHIPYYIAESIVKKVLINFGLEELSSENYLNKYYSRWRSEVNNLSGKKSFEIFTRLVERDLIKDLADKRIPLPITGKDIIIYFNIKPGPQVREYLEKATFLYISEPCTKYELLKKLFNSFNT